MASVYEINQAEPAQSDTENEYEVISDDKSIETLGEPGDGTEYSLGSVVNFLSREQNDTEGANPCGKTGQPTGDSDVRTDTKEYDGMDAASAAIANKVDKLYDNQEVKKLEPQLETIQSDFGTTRSTDAQNRQERKEKAEDTKLVNELSAAAIPVDTEDIESGLENRIVPKCLNEIAIFRSDQQYIKKKAPMRKRIDQLGFSARLIHSNLDIKLHNEGCLLTADDNFIAKVRILDSKLVSQTDDFDEAKKVLLKHLRIVNVIQDDLMIEKMTQKKSVLETIQTTLKNSLENGKPEVDAIQLSYVINTHDGTLDFGRLCEKITNDQLLSQKLRRTAGLYLLAETRCITRGNILELFGHRQSETNSSDLIAQLKTMLREYGAAYRKQLLEKAPTCLNATLRNFSNNRIMFVRSGDIKLFSDMVGVLDEKMFQKPLADLAGRWIDHVGKTKIKNLLSIEPQTSSVFYFLAKSLEDLLVEISSRTEHTAEDLLISNNSGWHPIQKITWKSENVLTQCIEREYFFIFKLLKHFDLGTRNEKKPFAYNVKVLDGPKQQSTWNKLGQDTKKFFGYAKASGNSLKFCEEKYVWYCLLDDVLYHILPAEYQLENFEQILRAYISFLSKAGRDELETLRVMTRNTACFIVQTMSYMVQKDSSSTDGQILQKQLDLINTKSIQHSLTSHNFRDLVDVFNVYWKSRDKFITGKPFKISLPEMTSLKTTLLEIVSLALKKNVSPEVMGSFFRAYSDLLTDLNDVQFDWYIKPFPSVSMDLMVDLKLIKLIDNKWANTINRTYSVEAVEKFVKTVPVLFEDYPYPKHYVLEILLTLISYIKNQLQKTTWNSGDQLSEMVQISTTNELIFAVRNSFLYLKEQPEYVSFEMFFDERIKPFANAVENSSSPRDFINRIYLIKESFWYIGKQNEMDIDKALVLLVDLNAGFETEVLHSAYQKYADSFQLFMEMCCDVSEHIAKATHIANKVKEITFAKSHQTWTNKDKLEKIPEILAGLAAVWSIIVSKDVSNTGKYLTPHCIQILCILRLLSVDRAENGVVSHLSQVLTGQGKSLVLGLTATLLALTGHNTRIVCYNEYLVKRDRQDFKHFITMFDLSDSIIYSTIEDMAKDLIAPVVNGERMGLRNSVEQMLLGKEQPNKKELVAEDMRKSVLLIDEVDVFFTSQFYGSQFYPIAHLLLPGLDLIQQKIWNILSQREWVNINEITKDIYSYIDSEEMKKEEKFHEFIANEIHYNIFIWNYEMLNSSSCSNKQLFDIHLKEMIRCALDVSTLPADKCNEYKLSSQGTILHKRRGKFANNHVRSYYSVFNYFRLRGSNFITEVENEINYGYLVLDCGTISYARLPKSYPLILGVSNTLVDLNQYEKQSIKNLYDINEMSVMPTYFGGSNLSFDQSHDFRVLNSLSDWKTEIFARVNTILGAHRSVLVFFESDLLLNSFHAEYCSQFDRLNVLTENTESALVNQCIEEAGVPKTTTLATSGMGRGVDYKSSVAIEKHGGLHVIQTFFSLDVKEETQIKGRTARKDNHGSYELIICKVHLSEAGFCGDNYTYRSLHETRLARALEDNERIFKTISDCKHNHDTTMTYLESFFKR